MKIVLAGANGFIGTALVKKLLEGGHSLVVLSRSVDAFKDVRSPDFKVQLWDGRTRGSWDSQVEGADAVVNLCGEGIANKRWTGKRKEVLRASRLEPTTLLAETIGRSARKPRVLVNASAIGYYGDVPSGEVTERTLKGRGFLPDLCAEWEDAAKKTEAFGVRVVMLRFGIVLEKDGGALGKFLFPFNLYAGGPLGSGKQYFPWVHRADVVGAIVYAIENSSLSGPANVTAPNSLTMKEFCSVLGSVMRRPSWLPVPVFALKILFGEMSEILLTGQKAAPKRLSEAGYRFRFEDAGQALRDILR